MICISDSVAADVKGWLANNSSPLPYPDVRSFRLGFDIQKSVPTRGRPENADSVLAALATAPVFLSVGTIEPRKGQAQTLDAFELLWENDVHANLVFVGKEGWMMESFVHRLREHPEQGKRLFWLAGISDEYLDEIYDAAVCLIAASKAEGFGLPLVEAASHGVAIVARDIPVFTEVAGLNALYFSGDRPEDLAQALLLWLEAYEQGDVPRPEGIEQLTWQESADQLRAILTESS